MLEDSIDGNLHFEPNALLNIKSHKFSTNYQSIILHSQGLADIFLL
jgi:hypothetical protein